MAFLQDLGKKISNVAQDASRKTGAAVFSMDRTGEPLV